MCLAPEWDAAGTTGSQSANDAMKSSVEHSSKGSLPTVFRRRDPVVQSGGGRLVVRGGCGLSALRILRIARILRIVVAAALLVALAACSRVNATRDFNHGVQYFNDRNFDASVRSFERASEVLEGPAIRYNLALARLASLRGSKASEDSKARARRFESALTAVVAARALAKPSDPMLAKLGYIEGSIHALAGDHKAARSAFAKSLASESGFRPTLKALLKLDPASESAVGRLVLATVAVEPLKLESKPDDTIAR